MMNIIQAVKSKLGSSRKGVVIDIDFLIGYLLFIFLIVLVIQFMLGLATPFNDNIVRINREKDTLALSSLLMNELSINEFSKACNINYTNIARLSVSYEIKGFYAPSKDQSIIFPNATEGVEFYRDDKTVRLLIGNNDSAKRITVQLITDKPVAVINSSFEQSDNLTIYTDSFNNQVIIVESSVGNSDLDELIITVSEKTLFTYLINGAVNTYIGDKSITDYCGERGLIAPSTSFQRYGIITDDKNFYPAIITGDAWWTG